MQISVTPKGKSEVTIKVELSPEEMQTFLDRAATALSSKYKIEGFRPGKASLGIVVQKLGQQTVWQEAAELAVRKTYPEAVLKEHIRSIGQPVISIVKLAPDNPFIYQADVATLPEVKLGNYQQLKSKKPAVTVKPEEIEKSLEDLRSMFAKESLVSRPIQVGDKVEVDFDLYLNKIPVEGGSSKNHPVIIGSKNFIPGFEENLIGLSKDGQKEFSLTFPQEYHNQQLAGKAGEFKVTVKAVFQIEKPALDDEFAKRAGKFQTLAELRSKVEENLRHEADHEADLEWERTLMDEVISQTTIGPLPELLLKSETEKMIHEIEDEVMQRGVSMDDYLKGLKKTKEELAKEFELPAIRRVKSALILRTIAVAEKTEVPKEEVEHEVSHVLEAYKDQPELRSKIDTEDYRSYVRNMLVNRKVVQQLKEWTSAEKK